MSITITAKELREALEFVNPDGPEDADQMETEVTIWFREKAEVSTDGDPLPRGLYCHLSEYPEEGCIPLFDATPSDGAIYADVSRRANPEAHAALDELLSDALKTSNVYSAPEKP